MVFAYAKTKDADQLRGNREADQRLCFRYTDSTIPLLPKSEISSPKPSSVIAQPGLVSDLVGNPEDWFSDVAAHISKAQARIKPEPILIAQTNFKYIKKIAGG